VPQEYREWFALDGAKRPMLERLFRQQLGWVPEIGCQLLSRADRGRSAEDIRSRRYREAQEHPLVQDVLRMFDADVIAREPSTRDDFLGYQPEPNGFPKPASPDP